MTTDEAIEACARAILRRMGQPESTWQTNPMANDFATKLVPALEALGLWPTKPTSE
jgi:hypothetical protein